MSLPTAPTLPSFSSISTSLPSSTPTSSRKRTPRSSPLLTNPTIPYRTQIKQLREAGVQNVPNRLDTDTKKASAILLFMGIEGDTSREGKGREREDDERTMSVPPSPERVGRGEAGVASGVARPQPMRGSFALPVARPRPVDDGAGRALVAAGRALVAAGRAAVPRPRPASNDIATRPQSQRSSIAPLPPSLPLPPRPQVQTAAEGLTWDDCIRPDPAASMREQNIDNLAALRNWGRARRSRRPSGSSSSSRSVSRGSASSASTLAGDREESPEPEGGMGTGGPTPPATESPEGSGEEEGDGGRKRKRGEEEEQEEESGDESEEESEEEEDEEEEEEEEEEESNLPAPRPKLYIKLRGLQTFAKDIWEGRERIEV